MNNQVNLTEDELSLIVTSLYMTMLSTKSYLEKHGKDSLDWETMKTYAEMKTLHNRLSDEYF